MNDIPPNKRLFIGGSADGQWLEVDPQAPQHRISSTANLPDGTYGERDHDPRPKRVPVVEVYEAITVTDQTGTETAFVLNALTPDAIQPQVVKHFGPEATWTPGH